MVQPWAEAGFTCYCVDLKHPEGETVEVFGKGHIVKVGANVSDYIPPLKQYAFASFFPPCTDVAVSGARWFKDKGLGRLIEALKLFKISVEIGEWCGCPYFIENPVSTVSTYWREPDYYFQPYEYGDTYSKKTCLWVGGGFKMPEKSEVEPIEGSRMHLLPPSEDRSEKRSVTPKGFANAVFNANKPFNKEIQPTCSTCSLMRVSCGGNPVKRICPEYVECG